MTSCRPCNLCDLLYLCLRMLQALHQPIHQKSAWLDQQGLLFLLHLCHYYNVCSMCHPQHRYWCSLHLCEQLNRLGCGQVHRLYPQESCHKSGKLQSYGRPLCKWLSCLSSNLSVRVPCDRTQPTSPKLLCSREYLL